MKIIQRLKEIPWLYDAFYSLGRRLFSDKLTINGLSGGGGKIKIEQIKGKGNRLVYGNNCKINYISVKIRGNNNVISIGDNCKIRQHVQFYLHGDNGKIEIGRDCTINSYTLIQADEGQSITIGNDCMLSNHITMRTSDNHPIYDFESDRRLNNPKSISVGNHVWLAAGATIMKGVKIGDGSVVGTNSIVTHDVPVNAISAGVPAKTVKTGIVWKRDLE